jgi:ABC-type branched-subunit amino acid transport system ATPase component/ABC-type branched-subunit amino acid transport system permease subunit
MISVFRSPVALATAVLVLLSMLWLVLGAPLSLITQIAIYTLYGIGVNLLVGYTGLVPFGASVFFGTSSYAAAIFLLRGEGDDIAALIFSVVFSMLLALAIGVLILRRRGLYFSLLTLAFSQIAFEIAFKWTDVTGGENGLQDVPRTNFQGSLAFHAFTVVGVVAVIGLLWRLVHAPFGRVLQAVRDNEQRAASLGYDTFRIRLGAFVLTGTVVGFAGALLTLMLQGAYADNLSWQHAGDSLLMTVLGGVHHFLGPLWGAIAFILLENRLSAITENWWLLFAPIIIAFALFSPEGITGLARRIFRRDDWTLVRNTIPPRPAKIIPFNGSAIDADRTRPILQVKGLSKNFGSLVTARNIDLDVYPFQLHSFIGPNGAGKTTFFNMLTGVLPPSAGVIRFNGHDVTRLPMFRRARLGIGRSFQILSVFPNLTVFENVRVALQARHFGAWGFFTDAHRIEAINKHAWSLLDAVGLADRAGEVCLNLPHGAKRLLEIAITLATSAKILLLDEPLAGLAEADRQVVAALIRRLADTHAVLLIEHDIDRVLKLSDRITVLHQGRLIADGKPAEVAANPDVIAAYLGAAEQVTLKAAGQSAAADAETLLDVKNLAVGYGGGTVLDGVDFRVRKGEAVALLGRNGVGKTTLLRAISGSLRAHEGAVHFDGADISRNATYAINRAGISLVPEGRRLFPNLTVIENLRLAARPGGMGLDEIFGLFPRLRTRAKAKAENLSGGERQMVAIARALVVPSRLILLDEPFEGLAPAIVREVMEALVRLRGRVAMVIVEHHAESVLPITDHAYVLVNGRVAYEGSARRLEEDHALQARLLGVVHVEELPAEAAE